jgi:biliverdin reductase
LDENWSGDVIRIGLVGAGFVSRLRAEAIAADGRAQLVAVASQHRETAAALGEPYGAEATDDWRQLIQRSDVDLVLVAHINQDHGQVAEAALAAAKHVVVEYPLSLDVAQAEALIAQARQIKRLLHVEHIELLGGLHQAAVAHLGAVGVPHYVRYSTLSPKHPAPEQWTYHPRLFGFPLVGAQSRIHRLTQLFGPVRQVACQLQYDGAIAGSDGDSDRYRSCLCVAQLVFANDLVAEVTYGKGEGFWAATRRLEIHGSQGTLVFDQDQGELFTAAGSQEIPVGSRRGLFAQDTRQVLDYLTTGKPPYCDPADSLYSLRVAAAARQAALTGQVVELET